MKNVNCKICTSTKKLIGLVQVFVYMIKMTKGGIAFLIKSLSMYMIHLTNSLTFRKSLATLPKAQILTSVLFCF